MMEVLCSPITWFVVAIAFVGSLFTCKDFADRFWFTVIMPIVYYMIYFLCLFTISAIVGNVFPRADGSLDVATLVLAASACYGIFVLQVCSMANDPRG